MKSQDNYTLNITTTNQDNHPLSNLKIQVLDKKDDAIITLAESTTNQQGQCALQISSKEKDSKHTDFFIKILKEDQIIFRLEGLCFEQGVKDKKITIQLLDSKLSSCDGENEFNLNIKALSQQGEVLSGYKIEVWDMDKGSSDDFLGEAMTDEKGCCKISFGLERANDKNERRPDVYLKVYHKGELLYNSKDAVIYWGLNTPQLDVILRVPICEVNYPVPDLPIQTHQFNTPLSDLTSLTGQVKNYIDEKINQQFIDRLISAVGVSSEKVKEVIIGLQISYEDHLDTPIKDLVNDKIIPALKENPETSDLLENIPTEGSGQDTTSVKDILQLDLPIKKHPRFQQDIRKIKTHVLSDIAVSDSSISDHLSNLNIPLEYAPETEWIKLVEDGVITEGQKTDLQYTFDLGKMTGDNFDLIKKMKQDDRIRTTKDLVYWREEDWEDYLDEGFTTPNGEDREVYIKNILKVVERTYPTEYTITRLVVEKGEVEAEVKFVNKLLDNNDDLFSKEEINWDGVSETKKPKVEESLNKIKGIANKYQYLGIKEIVNSQITPKQKAKAVKEAVGAIQTFYKNNPDMDLLNGNFIKKPDSDDTKFNWSGISEKMQPMLQKQLLAVQRVHALSPDFETSNLLLENNLDSAYKISYRGRRGFMADTKLPKEKAKAIFAHAQKKAVQAVQQYHSIVELHHNQQLGLTVDNTIVHNKKGFGITHDSDVMVPGDAVAKQNITLFEQVRNELKEIYGYEDLFGPQNFCSCDHCKSIFSPAAYFVDMMHFVDKHITEYSSFGLIPTAIEPVFPEDEGPATFHHANKNANHPLWLENRRPDLWNIELTCDCTYEMVPYLQIVNQVKEAYIKKLWAAEAVAGGGATQLDDVYESIKNVVENKITFYAPASKAFQEVLILLEHFDESLLSLVKANGGNINDQTLAYFEMHIFEMNASLNPFKLFGNKDPFDNIEVREFLKYAKVSRSELDDLLATNYVKNRGSIKIVKAAFDEGIQYWHEQMIDIDEKGLAYLHHYIRLWKKLPWTIKELDLVFDTLYEIYAPGGIPSPNNPYQQNYTQRIYRLAQIQEQLNIGVEELIGIVYMLPEKSISIIERKDPLTQELYQENVPGYRYRHFDLEKIMGTGTSINIDSTNSAHDEKFAYFLSGLKINSEDFNEMVNWGSSSFNTNISGDGIKVLSSYFRHIQLAKRLKVSLKEWNQILQLTQNDVSTITKMLDLIEWVKAQKKNPFTYEELLLLTASNTSQLITTEEIISALHHEEYPTFTRDIFKAIHAVETDIDDLQNKLITDSLIEEVDDVLRLTSNFDWTKLNTSIASLTVWNTFGSELQEALTPYHYLEHLAAVYNTEETFSTQCELSKENSIALLEELAAQNAIVVTADRQHFRVLDAYDNTTLQSVIDDWTNVSTQTQEEADALEQTQTEFQNSKELIDAYLVEAKNNIANQYYALWQDVGGLAPEIVDAIVPFMVNDWQTNFFTLFGNENEAASPMPLNFANFAEEVKLKTLLFGRLDLPATSIDFIRQNASSVFGINDIQYLDSDDIEAMVKYKEWFLLDETVAEDTLHPMLVEIKANSNRAATVIAFDHYFELPENITEDVFSYNGSVINFFNNIEFADHLRDMALLCQKLGVTKSQMQLTANTVYSKKQKFANTLKAAIRGQYEKEEDFKKAIEPYEEKIEEAKRDILCEYILARSEVNFKDTNELYAYFLLDPEMSGCMKISKIVAAHLSLQLYIHRTMMNFEQSNDEQFKAFLEPEVHEEWEWRKNYRVWEANRKVAVYPENFIEPEWRDNKSPEFKQLEEELLQEKITIESAERAYVQYLKKFSVLGKLKIAGSCYHPGNSQFPHPTYHIFGRTHTDPYQYYYRRLNILEDKQNQKEAKDYSAWEKIDLPISAPLVSSIVFRNKLYIFWLDIVHERITDVTAGTMTSLITEHKITLNYSYLMEDGKWLQPQKINYLTNSDDSLIRSKNLTELSDYKKSRTYRIAQPFVRDNELYMYYHYVAHPDSLIVNLDDEIVDLGQRRSRAYKIDFFQNKAIQLWGAEIWGEGASITINYNSLSLIKDGNSVKLSKIKFYRLFSDIHDIIPPNSFHQVLYSGNDVDYFKTTPDIRQINPNYSYDLNNQLDYSILKLGDSILSVNGDSFMYRNLHNVKKRVLNLGANFQLNTVTQLVEGEIERMNSTLGEKFQNILLNQGLVSLLKIKNQKFLEEGFPFNINHEMLQFEEFFEARLPEKLYFKGAFGMYFRELFFHTPFLIADHLNAEGKYKDADWWYRKIFDPTAAKDEYMTNPVDRNWQYIEFRDLDFPKYSEMLSDNTFIEVYRKDPFNPHAIARLRTSAYQKAIVLKYIDNLLDWGDSLFRGFTFEKINEAMMLYVLAQDILGERPQELCKCDTGADDNLTYQDVSSKIEEGNEFLIWLENQQQVITQIGDTNVGAGSNAAGQGTTSGNIAAAQLKVDNAAAVNNGNSTKAKQVLAYDDVLVLDDYGESSLEKADNYVANDGKLMTVQSITTRKPIFCVPMNKEILGLWNRVEDRLFKIRHCMNIDGVKQTLSLFAPEIDPRLLVAARASGLSIADAIANLDAPVPNYRFNYMIEKAKSFTGTVQSFGGALLSALEKKDGEELTLLRSVHEQNILKMTTEIKKQQIEESKVQVKNLEETKTNIENRIDYYTELIGTGLIPWEKTQQIATHTESSLYAVESVFATLYAVFGLLPDIGAPTAMKYGGTQLKEGAAGAATAINAGAKAARALATSAAYEGGNQRREQEWKNQLKMAEQELIAMDQQILAAEIRLAIAEKDLETHKAQIEQAKELYDFYKDKFTNIGLYKYMSTTLSRLFSQAYNLAFDMAKKAEKCLQFETNKMDFFIENDNWDSGHAGLLAGERLMLQLQRMEKAYIENTPRRDEITQAFSLRMLAPEKLVELQKNGSCSFTIPEWAYNIFYPGHYRRTIKTVRLTIPCVAGPYTNISCRLSLTQNKLRTKPSLADGPYAGPNFANDSISTSTANNDGGQFELNFQDARYLPFEGAGAIDTQWTLSLPDGFRPFDYNTISDAIIHISYTALYDSTLKSAWEDQQNGLLVELSNQTLYRLISLKQEFPDALYQVQSTGTATTIKLTKKHFPFLFSGKTIDPGTTANVWDGTIFTPVSNAISNPATDEWSIDVGNPNFILSDDDMVLLLEYQIS